MGRYGHWQLYDERFQTNVFQIWFRHKGLPSTYSLCSLI
jgi:hypothetical protein